MCEFRTLLTRSSRATAGVAVSIAGVARFSGLGGLEQWLKSLHNEVGSSSTVEWDTLQVPLEKITLRAAWAGDL